MRRLPFVSLALIGLVLAGCVLTGCAAPRPAEQAYIANAQGAVTAGTRSALDGTTAPGPQELIGVYIPLPPFAIKAGLTWDGNPLIIAPPAPFVAPASSCAGPQYVEQTVTEMVPETRMVPRTRTVRKVAVPIPVQSGPCPEPVSIAEPECNGTSCRLVAGR